MKKTIKIVLSLLIISGLIYSQAPKTILSSNDSYSKPYAKLKNLSSNPDIIYTDTYQKNIYQQIEKIKKQKNYTFTNPLLIENPYGTNTTGVYIYFTTTQPCKVTYTISCDGYNDFSQTLNNNSSTGYTKEHEYLIIGAIADAKNTIKINLIDENDQQIDSIFWTYQAPELQSDETYQQVEMTNGTSATSLSQGLYTVLGNDETEDNESLSYMHLYDNDGILRSEIPLISYRSHRALFDDNTMYISISSTAIVGIEQTGYVSKIYDTGNYKLHHDYIFDNDNNLIVLASEKEAKTSEDKIILIEQDSGDIKELVDLIEIFPDYYKTTSKPESADDLDWMHINSLTLMNDDSLIISSRETSTIIKLDNVYDDVTVDYMIGSDQFWQESGYDDLLLNKIGDFSLQAGQHCVTYQSDDSLANGQYYLYLYNNNLAVSSTRADYNWQEDSNYQNVSFNIKKGTSYYYKYLIDENAGTVTLVKSIPVDYSGYVSSVQETNNNYVIDSGMAMSWGEYDQDGNLIKKFTTTGGKFVYRVFKYDYQNYWFQ